MTYSTMTLETYNDLSAKVAAMWEQVHGLQRVKSNDTDQDDDDEDQHAGPDTDSDDDDEDEKTQALASGLRRKIGHANFGEGKVDVRGSSAGKRLRKALHNYRKDGEQATGRKPK